MSPELKQSLIDKLVVPVIAGAIVGFISFVGSARVINNRLDTLERSIDMSVKQSEFNAYQLLIEERIKQGKETSIRLEDAIQDLQKKVYGDIRFRGSGAAELNSVE